MGLLKKWNKNWRLFPNNKYTAFESQQLWLSVLMSKYLMMLTGLISLSWMSHEAPAQSITGQQFEAQFYGLERIGPPMLYAPGVSKPKQWKDLIRARDSLMEFLKALRKLGEDAAKLTAPPFSNRYKSDFEINKEFFGPESYLFSSAVTNFHIPVSHNKIMLDLFIVIDVEAIITIVEACATMVTRLGGWRVADFMLKKC